MGRMKTFGKLLTKFNLEKPGKWHFLSNHAMIKTWKLIKNDLEKPGVRPLWESGDPELGFLQKNYHSQNYLQTAF